MTLQQLRYTVVIAEQKSFHKAAKALFLSQPSLSNSIKELEIELGIEIFHRSNRGISLTVEGEEFLQYARQMIEQYNLIEERYMGQHNKSKFSVSMQHYTFAVQAFIQLAKQYGMDEYEFAVHETKTCEVLENVKHQKSELGILYRNQFNKIAFQKIVREYDLEFIPLFQCNIYVFLWSGHPLAQQELIHFDELEEYPFLSFEQGSNNSFYYSEEVFSTYGFKRMIKVDDRATMLNLVVGLDGFTLCSGIICEDLNGEEYKAIPLDTTDRMEIGYIKRKNWILSELALKYIQELEKYEQYVL